MRLNTRISTIMFIYSIIVTLYIIIFFNYTIIGSYQELEDDEIKNASTSLNSVVENEFDYMAGRNIEWAFWDDMADYTQSKDMTFVDKYLGPGVIETVGINFFYILDVNKEIIHLIDYDMETQDLAENDLNFVNKIRNSFDDAPYSGFFNYKDKVYLLSIEAIKKTDGSGKAHGYIVMGYHLDEAQTNILSSKFISKINFDVKKAKPIEISKMEKTDDSVKISLCYPSLDSEFHLCVSSNIKRDIMQAGKTTFRRIAFTSAITLLIFIFIVYHLINWQVIKRVLELNKRVKEISLDDEISKRVKINGLDEIADLKNEINDMLDIIESNRNDLANKNQEIIESIEYARLLQETILPRHSIFDKHFGEYFIHWNPKDTIGGDFYWAYEADNNFYFAIADCTGHGVPGALMTMSASATLNNLLTKKKEFSTGELMGLLNKNLKNILNKDKNKYTDDGLDIAICKLNLASKSLEFTGAKINLKYLEKDKSELQIVKGDRQSVGYIKSQIEYEYSTYQLDTTDKQFYFTTDGFVDQNGGVKNLPYGKKRLKNLLEENRELSLTEQKEIIIKDLKEYMGKEVQRDDITLLGFKI